MAFDNIVSDDPEYTVTISTELNGRTVTQMVEKFPVGSPQDGEEEAAAAAPNDGDDRPGEEGGGGVFVKEKVGNRTKSFSTRLGRCSSMTLNELSLNAGILSRERPRPEVLI